MRPGCLCVVFALLCSAFGVQSFFIRSHIPQGKTCNQTAGQECFAVMFTRMSEVCSTEPLTFKCIHYNFLDQCFNTRVGYCESTLITSFARAGFREAQRRCVKTNNKAYREDPFEGMRLEILPSSVISRQFDDEKPSLSDPQVIATLGYLQTQCSIIQNMSCTSQSMEHVFDNCEHEIRFRSNPTSNDFDRHKLLRIKLDTSRKLLSFMETENRHECIMVRWALAEIFKIHQSHCFHSIMSRCLCERGEFDKRCKIDCSALEVQPPVIHEEDWESMRESLSRSRASAKPWLTHLWVFALFCALVKGAYRI